MKTILLLGGYGMLGTDLYDVLGETLVRDSGHKGGWEDAEVLRFSSSDLDITDSNAVREAFVKQRPAWVINCAAYTAVDKAEDEPDRAAAVNAYAVEHIGRAAREVGARVLHFSTDYVFDGTQAEGYTETDRKHPLGSYGLSKSQGEDVLLESNPGSSSVIRTAWLYGRHRKNFVTTIRRLASEKSEIRVVADQRGCPTWTRHLALSTLDLLHDIETGRQQQAPVFHLTNAGSCTWYDFAREILRLSGSNTPVIPIPTAEYPTRATRPASSILRNTLRPALPPWQDALSEFLSTP